MRLDLTPEQVRLISDWAHMSAERAGHAPTGLLYQEIYEAAEDALEAPLATIEAAASLNERRHWRRTFLSLDP